MFGKVVTDAVGLVAVAALKQGVGVQRLANGLVQVAAIELQQGDGLPQLRRQSGFLAQLELETRSLLHVFDSTSEKVQATVAGNRAVRDGIPGPDRKST